MIQNNLIGTLPMLKIYFDDEVFEIYKNKKPVDKLIFENRVLEIIEFVKSYNEKRKTNKKKIHPSVSAILRYFISKFNEKSRFLSECVRFFQVRFILLIKHCRHYLTQNMRIQFLIVQF